MIYIDIAKDFSSSPGGRYKKDGYYSGEEFRDNILIPKYREAIKNNELLHINLDGCYGYPLSFLEEVFGGLIIKEGNDKLSDILLLTSKDEPYLTKQIYHIINDARLKIGMELGIIPIKKSKIYYKILLRAIIEIFTCIILVSLIPFIIFRYVEYIVALCILAIIVLLISIRYQSLILKKK